MESFRVPDALNQKRLDIVLSSHEKICSRAEAQRLIHAGIVQINRSTEKATAKKPVKAGDIITFNLLPQSVSEVVPVPYALDILFEDPFLLIVNKPSGVVVHPAAGHTSDTLVNFLLYHSKLSGKDPIRPGIVHRIDKDTSGLLVIAKDNKTHDHLAQQFFEHTILRIYQAIVWGVPKQSNGIIDKPLGRHPQNRKKITIKENGKRAKTLWNIVKTYRYLSLVECSLETGRTHQIRVHLSSIGHPLLGDLVYGSFKNYAQKFPAVLKSTLKACDGQALHAKSLGFIHPKTGKWLEYHSDLPKEMRSVIQALEKAYG
ncbi:MAG: RluA family pseudouridine synthase [SAR324 cluster bacterium]|nr:RluA family pseudouridine synthase [SAR324 cluster bacterium]